MVGEPAVGVHIFFNYNTTFFSKLSKTVSCAALSGCLGTKKFTVVEADNSSWVL